MTANRLVAALATLAVLGILAPARAGVDRPPQFVVMAFDKWIHCHPLSRMDFIPVPMAASHGRERPTLMAIHCLEWKRCQGGVQGRKLLDNAGTEGILLARRVGRH